MRVKIDEDIIEKEGVVLISLGEKASALAALGSDGCETNWQGVRSFKSSSDTR